MSNPPNPSGNPRSIRSNGDRRGVLLIAAAVTALVVVVGIVVALGGTSSTNSTTSDKNTGYGPVVVEGASLPAFSTTSGDEANGVTPPFVEGVDPDGNPVSIGGGRGSQPTMVVFLAHWCPHCQKEVPVIAEWIEQNGPPEGVALVSIATATVAERPNYPPSAWLEREGWQPVVLADDEQGSAATAYGLTAFPFFVAVDAQGKVVERVSGELTVQQIEDLVARARGVG